VLAVEQLAQMSVPPLLGEISQQPSSYGTVLTDDLEKPALDDRSYRVIRLPNKLEALLVHDPDTDKASASLNVNVGSFSDEDDMPGMAHAVEHALFMGTKKVCSSRYMIRAPALLCCQASMVLITLIDYFSDRPC